MLGWLLPLLRRVMPGQLTTTENVGRAMINAASKGYPKQILEVKDIVKLAKA